MKKKPKAPLYTAPSPEQVTRLPESLSEAQLKHGIRDAAVALVDVRHGYTVEFSHWRTQHLDQYEELEQKLTAELVHRFNLFDDLVRTMAQLVQIQDALQDGADVNSQNMDRWFEHARKLVQMAKKEPNL